MAKLRKHRRLFTSSIDQAWLFKTLELGTDTAKMALKSSLSCMLKYARASLLANGFYSSAFIAFA